MTGTDDMARAAQVADLFQQNELRGRLMRTLIDTHPLPEDMPLAYDDWVLDERLAYFAVFAVYIAECKRYALLLKGKGPFFCRRCEEAQPGWTALPCWECAWETKIRPKAMECATRWHETKEGAA